MPNNTHFPRRCTELITPGSHTRSHQRPARNGGLQTPRAVPLAPLERHGTPPHPRHESLVTSTDPVLSQAIAKGPFTDKYVPRALREIISAEAGSNDGFGPFLLLATYLIRHTPEEDVTFKPGVTRIAGESAHRVMARAGDVGRLGGAAGQAVEIWIAEGWLYSILTGAVVGALCGIASMYAVNFSLKK